MRTSIIIGLLIGAIAFPMVIIPVIGIGAIVWAFYVLFHDIIWPSLHQHRHTE